MSGCSYGNMQNERPRDNHEQGRSKQKSCTEKERPETSVRGKAMSGEGGGEARGQPQAEDNRSQGAGDAMRLP